MMREAEAHAAEDQKRREEVETRNRADQAIYTAEKFIKDSGDKLDPADRMAVEGAVNDVKKALEANDVTGIDRTLDALMQAQQKAGEALYKGAGDAGAGAGGDGGSGGSTTGGNGQSDDVIDAEIVDDKK